MPKNKPTVYRITGAFVELIHDELVARLWPGDQPVNENEYRDQTLIDSAVNRPFQEFGGVEFYPTVREKAAPLFHSLVCNHPFGNGNKRTAVIAVDLFMNANGLFLALTNDQMYDLAKRTARHNEEGIGCDQLIKEIARQFDEYSVEIENLKNEKGMEELYGWARESMMSVRNHPANQMQPH